MCTVSFVPGPARGGFLLASNRDESVTRPSASLACLHRLGGTVVAAPLDTQAGGTWIGVNAGGLALCLLNGEGPSAEPPAADTPSRGLVTLDLLPAPGADAAAERLERRVARGALRARPFLLLLAEAGRGRAPARLLRLAWDGRRLEAGPETRGPGLATSSTADPGGAARSRGEAFASLRRRLERAAPRAWRGMVLRWHASHRPSEPGGGPLSVCMHRPRARTVSRTLVEVGPGRIRLDYHQGWPCRPGPRSRVVLPR